MVIKESGVANFDWALIAEGLNQKIENENAVTQDLDKNDRDVEVIRYCLKDRSPINDDLLMSKIGIQSMLNFHMVNQAERDK